MEGFHDFACFVKGEDDALVVTQVVLRERAALAVLEPLLRRMVATDRLLPRGDRDLSLGLAHTRLLTLSL